MKLVNDPNLPTDNAGYYINRFKVNDIVYAGESASSTGITAPGTRGVIVKVINQRRYEITWDNGHKDNWYDFISFIIPDPKPTITKGDLVENYEI